MLIGNVCEFQFLENQIHVTNILQDVFGRNRNADPVALFSVASLKAMSSAGFPVIGHASQA